jgi:transposase-like protein
VALARQGQAPLTQIARDFGISETCLSNWLKKADIEDGNRPGLTAKEAEQVRELKRRRRVRRNGSTIDWATRAWIPGRCGATDRARHP